MIFKVLNQGHDSRDMNSPISSGLPSSRSSQTSPGRGESQRAACPKRHPLDIAFGRTMAILLKNSEVEQLHKSGQY